MTEYQGKTWYYKFVKKSIIAYLLIGLLAVSIVVYVSKGCVQSSQPTAYEVVTRSFPNVGINDIVKIEIIDDVRNTISVQYEDEVEALDVVDELMMLPEIREAYTNVGYAWARWDEIYTIPEDYDDPTSPDYDPRVVIVRLDWSVFSDY